MTSDTKSVFAAADDGFHFDVLSERWWETETCWFSFHHPERRLGGWFYNMVRPNIGTVAGGCWIWDDTAHLPWEVPYSTNYTALQLPEGADLKDVTLPNGCRIKVSNRRCPTSWATTTATGSRPISASTGSCRPSRSPRSGSTFGSAHHYDQLGRVQRPHRAARRADRHRLHRHAGPHLGPPARAPPPPGGLRHRRGRRATTASWPSPTPNRTATPSPTGSCAVTAAPSASPRAANAPSSATPRRGG